MRHTTRRVCIVFLFACCANAACREQTTTANVAVVTVSSQPSATATASQSPAQPSAKAESSTCLQDPMTVGYAVALPEDEHIILLTDDTLCGGDPTCPNAQVTYAWPFRITTVSCAWRAGNICDGKIVERLAATPESEPEVHCWQFSIEVSSAPTNPSEHGRIRFLPRPGANLSANGDVEVLVAR